MTPQTRTSLKELQQLDQEIAAVRLAAEGFEPLLEEVDAPVLRLEQDVKGLEKRLTEIRLEENRIELTIEERRVRAAKLQERMEAVRNVREEAAVHAELEMVRRALESEEQEALSLLDQIKRLEERHEEQDEAYREALAEVGPRRAELVQGQESTAGKLEGLQADRDAFAAGIDPEERRIYDSIMAGARDVAVSELTQDGACGNCYNMVPLQVQNRIRHSEAMIRCEGCGVILTPESAEGLARAKEEGERIERALRESTDERDAEREALAESVAFEEAEEAGEAEALKASEAEAEVEREVATETAGVGGVFDAFAETPVVEDTTPEGAEEASTVDDAAPDELPSDEVAVDEGGSDSAPADEPVIEAEGGSAVGDTVEDVAPDEGHADEEPAAEGGADEADHPDAAIEEALVDEVPVADAESAGDVESEVVVEDPPGDEPVVEEAKAEEADADG
ncbi:MAG TPA: hypothetical protein EYQ64_08645 [Gemmatimonadetes bacterium]|nr:hypothetical protein [Gemmatimonadota bacterium]